MQTQHPQYIGESQSNEVGQDSSLVKYPPEIPSIIPHPADGRNLSAVSIVEPGKNELITQTKRFPHNLPERIRLFLSQNGKAHGEMDGKANRYALPVGSRQMNNFIRKLAQLDGITLRKADIGDLNSHLQAQAEMAGIIKYVWYRVAQFQGGIIIDLGDKDHTHIRITKGNVVIANGSGVLFYRTQVSLPMVMPAEVGNIKLLEKYLNLHPASIILLLGWLTYTLAHPKSSSSKYLILVLQGNYGSGKSWLCRIIMQLLDPNHVGVQILPNNPKDLAIAAQNAHVLFYDNVREFKQLMSDALCIAATGGTLTTRQLYTDADQSVLHMHVALVLNGIHSFITEPDLAQRCLPIELLPIAESNRKSEAEIAKEFQADLPFIMRGLLELVADIFTHLSTAEVTYPERMIDFVKWMAAMEKAHGVPVGVYQGAYSNALNQGQMDSLMDNPLAAAVLEFALDQSDGIWTGTPAELLIALNKHTELRTQRDRDWPNNPIALSRRLKPLQHALLTQGISLDFARGKHRTITIKMNGEKHD